MNYSEKQVQIITTAEKLFAVKGYDGTSVRDIADAAGVNIAMISYYFGSKEKLMEALFEQRSTNIKLRVESLLHDDNVAPIQKLYNLAEDYVEKMMEKQQFFKIMMCEQVINKNPVIINLVKDLKKRNLDEINRLIADGQQKGVFKNSVDVVLLMNTLIGTATQMLIMQDFYREYYGLESVPPEQFSEQIKQKLNEHIKVLFKAVLSYEA